MRYCIFLVSLFIVNVLFAQSADFVKAFNKIKDTNFVLYATRWNVNSASPEVKSLKDFYVTDYKTIKYITNTWFAKPDSNAFYFCDYDYSLSLKHNDTIIWDGSINLDCKTSLFNHETYILPNNVYTVLKSHALYMKRYDSLYSNIEAARLDYKELNKNKNIVLEEDYHWLKYDGYTMFGYIVADTGYLNKENVYLKELNNKLKILQKDKNMYAYAYLSSWYQDGLFKYEIQCYFKESDRLDAISGFTKIKDWTKFENVRLIYYLKMKRPPGAY